MKGCCRDASNTFATFHTSENKRINIALARWISVTIVSCARWWKAIKKMQHRMVLADWQKNTRTGLLLLEADQRLLGQTCRDLSDSRVSSLVDLRFVGELARNAGGGPCPGAAWAARRRQRQHHDRKDRYVLLLNVEFLALEGKKNRSFSGRRKARISGCRACIGP